MASPDVCPNLEAAAVLKAAAGLFDVAASELKPAKKSPPSPRAASSPSPSPAKVSMSPQSATSEGRSSSRGPGSATIEPRGVQEWLERHRSPTTKSPAASVDQSPPHMVSSPPAHHGACKQPKGVQEWLQRHQSPLCKPSSLEETFGASMSVGSALGDKPTPSRSGTRSTTP